MPLSIDVKLPRDYTPVFPSRCVACGADSPDGSVLLSTQTIGWLSLLTLHNGSRFKTAVPACKRCKRRISLQKWLRGSALALFAVVGVLIAFRVLYWYRGFGRKWIAMAIVLLFCAPLIAWEIFNPRPVDVTAYSDSVEYEFLDARYAEEFIRLNDEHVL